MSIQNTIILAANRGFALYGSRLLLIRRLIQSGYKVVIVTAADEYAERLVQEGAQLEPIVFNRGGLTIWNDIRALFTMIRIYRRHQPCLIHHFHAKPMILGNIAAVLSLSRAKIINTVTGLGHAFIKGSIVKWLAIFGYRLLSMKSDLVVFQNPDDRQTFVDHKWVSQDKSRVIISSGIDIQRFTITNIPQPTIRVLMIARLLWQKGIGEFMEAAKLLKQEGIDAVFELIGEEDPVHPDAVEVKWLQAPKQKQYVNYLGYMSDIESALAKTDIFVLPSYREGVPRVILEASACEIPVITTDVPGCRSAIKSNETGLLVPLKDSHALADAIRTLIEAPELRKKMGKAGREFIQAEFDIHTITQHYLNLYMELGCTVRETQDHET